jgi:hypothetical protein
VSVCVTPIAHRFRLPMGSRFDSCASMTSQKWAVRSEKCHRSGAPLMGSASPIASTKQSLVRLALRLHWCENGRNEGISLFLALARLL